MIAELVTLKDFVSRAIAQRRLNSPPDAFMLALDEAYPFLRLKDTLAEDGGLAFLECKLNVFERACEVDQAAREYLTFVSQSKRGHLSSGTHSSAHLHKYIYIYIYMCVCPLYLRQ